MPLSNSQYDEIFRKYDEKQLASQHQLERRTKDVYARIPALKEIDDAIATCSVEQARRLLDGDEAALVTLREKLSDYRRQKEQLLQEHGLTSDYLKPVYHCPDCKDTGYVNGRRCHCFEQAAINLVYTQSNLKEILERENFSTFSFDYYSADDINPATGRSSLETARDAVAKCHDFIDHFDSSNDTLQICIVVIRRHVVLVTAYRVGEAVIGNVDHQIQVIAADRLFDDTLCFAGSETRHCS